MRIIGEGGGDAPVVHRADLERGGETGFRVCRFDAAIKPQDAKTGSKALLGRRPMREDGGDQRFGGVGADDARPAPEAVGSGINSA